MGDNSRILIWHLGHLKNSHNTLFWWFCHRVIVIISDKHCMSSGNPILVKITLRIDFPGRPILISYTLASWPLQPPRDRRRRGRPRRRRGCRCWGRSAPARSAARATSCPRSALRSIWSVEGNYYFLKIVRLWVDSLKESILFHPWPRRITYTFPTLSTKSISTLLASGSAGEIP